MVNMLYSNDLKIYSGTLPLSIEEALEEVRSFLKVDNISILSQDENNIALPLKLDINIPSKGTFEGIDIREEEPILLVINLKNYPTKAPLIKSDRKDFPVKNLSHLYVVRKNNAPSLCLVRENLDEWFANRRISDLIIVAKQWFSKASSGQLVEDGGEFDPVRLEGYRGNFIYEHEDFVKLISVDGDVNFTLVNYKAFLDDGFKNIPTYRFLDLSIKADEYDEILQLFAKLNLSTLKEYKKGIKDKFVFGTGLLIWNDRGETCRSYNTLMPSNYEELMEFCSNYSINISHSLDIYFKRGLNKSNVSNRIPIIVAVRRPKKIIGFSSDIEFFHFIIEVNKEFIDSDSISPETEVFFLAHREPVSSSLSCKLSIRKNLDKTLFLGAGALGSKLIFHYARSGNYNLTVIDNDNFSPHNIVRHDLFMDSTGKNKAKVVIEKIKSFNNDNLKLKSIERNIFECGRKLFDENKWFIDSSASLNVMNWIVNNEIIQTPNRARVEVANKGELGFLYIEGKNQNPRIDDLVNYIYFLGIKNKNISEWLINENKKTEGNDYDIVDIGVGCNSPTVIMSNDSMSYHASIFSKILNNEHDRKTIENNGLINISYISNDGFNINSKRIILKPFYIFTCQNNSGWKIRMSSNVLNKIYKEAELYGVKETGGIFIGLANYKTKTIHVFDTINAPIDSKRSTVSFYRGINNLPESINSINDKTGNMIGYIGEWHTHPMGLDKLSEVDMKAIRKLKPLNDKYPIPTFMSILSKDKFLPYIF
ncbi:MAG: ThiF family adenylyltransferase [Bacteroidota bacterium]